MNKKAIDKLWLVANKVRGRFEIFELYKVMLCALFLRYVELKNDKRVEENAAFLSYDDKFSLGYLALTYGKMIYALDVLNYVTKVETELGIDENVISSEMYRLFERADEESIRIIFTAVNEIQVEGIDDLYQIAEYILYRFSVSGGKTTAEVTTNPSLSKLEGRLLECQEDMLVYDGFCGCGLSVNEVANQKGIVYIQDVNASTIAIATIVTLLKGNKIGIIKCSDSLLNPLNGIKFDRIVCEPPFMPRYTKDYLQSALETDLVFYGDDFDSESLALRHVLAHLKTDGVAAVLVPTGMLFKSGRTGGIREKLVCDKYIEAVIEFPSGLMPATGVSTALLILKKDKADDVVCMINAKSFFHKVEKKQLMLGEESIDRIVEIYRNKECIEGISNHVSVKEIADNDFNLCTTQYVLQKPEETIVIGNISKYNEEYKRLTQNLKKIDDNLDKIRGRWM